MDQILVHPRKEAPGYLKLCELAMLTGSLWSTMLIFPPSNVSLVSFTITATLLLQSTRATRLFYHSFPVSVSNTAKATHLLLVHPPQQPHTCSQPTHCCCYSTILSCSIL